VSICQLIQFDNDPAEPDYFGARSQKRQDFHRSFMRSPPTAGRTFIV
jgi:hypothetical protein